jgi:peroxiredoxin
MNQAPLTALRDVFLNCRDLDASLAERLETYSRAVRELLPSYADAVEQLVSHLNVIGAGSNAPQTGEPMPPFVLPDQEGRLVSLANVLERGPAAITFHRGHWCPWCRINANTLASVQDEITEAGGQVVAIMPDRQRFAAEFKREAASPFMVLTDLDNGYALLLNLAIWVGPDLERMLTSYERRLPDYQGNDSWTLPIPATFVVDQEGIVRTRFVDPDFRRRMTIDDLIGALCVARGQPAGG